MGKLGHLDPSLSPHFILSPWNESLSIPLGKTPISMAKSHKCSMLTVLLKVLTLHYQL